MRRIRQNNDGLARPASEKQIAFARSLAEQVHGPDNAPEFLAAHEEEGTFLDSKATSLLIDALLAAPKAPRKVEDAPKMPDSGYYCAEYLGVLRFYAVKPGKGKWEGRVWLNRFRSDFQDRVGREEQRVVVAAILADPIAAREQFARETVHCFRCGRKLTDQASRDRGVGPECVKFV